MKKLVCLIIFNLFIFNLLLSKSYSQQIVFHRTDGEKADFVTAGHSFEIDILLEGINNCSHVAFELRHSFAEFIKYSGMKESSVWNTDKSLSLVESLTDSNSTQARLAVTVGTGYIPNDTSPNNPKVIHLKFVVLRGAPHHQVLTFSIDNMKAAVYRNNDAHIIDIPRFTIEYVIRGYVEIWPGDANCDGVVNTDDFTTIAKYYTDTDIYYRTRSRSFKRDNVSTLWQPQLCLAWDNLIGTYCDCNGDSFVTTSDILVARNNLDSTHTNRCNYSLIFPQVSQIRDFSLDKNKYSNDLQEDAKNDFVIDENTIAIPIQIDNTDNSIRGVTGFINYHNYEGSDSADINISNIGIKIVGMKIGEFFNDNDFLFYHIGKTEDNIFFTVGTKNNLLPPAKTNTVAYLYVKSDDNTLPHQNVDDFVGIDIFGEIKNLYQPVNSIINEDFDDLVIKYYNETFNILNCNFAIKKVKISNLFGCVIAELSPNTNCDLANSSSFHIGNLSNGIYFIEIIGNNKTIMNKFYVIN